MESQRQRDVRGHGFVGDGRFGVLRMFRATPGPRVPERERAIVISSRRLSASWSRYFGHTSAEQARAARPLFQQPAPAHLLSRETLEVGWLLRCLPSGVQAALVPDLLALKRSRPFRGALPVDDYTWPDVPGVWRPRYPGAVLNQKTLEGLCSRLRDELALGVKALCAPESDLPRPMRNALLAMQGRRLGQLAETLARWLEPEEIALLFREELAARQ